MSQWWCKESTVWGLALHCALRSREEGEAVTAGMQSGLVFVADQINCPVILKVFFPHYTG